MIHSAQVILDRVCITRGEDCTYLTFAEVKAAAEVLRAHLLTAMPPEVPAGDPGYCSCGLDDCDLMIGKP